MNDDDLKDLLDSAAPDRPDLTPSARTTAVQARARAVRRRRGLVLATAVVAVVAAVGAVAVPALRSGDASDGTDVASDPTPAEVAPVTCPDPPLDVSEGLGVDDLPAGATSARLCPATFVSQQGTPDFTLPTEPVTEGADALVTALRDLRPRPLPDMCALASVAVMPWSLVVGYPDGSTRALGTTTTACATVAVEGRDVLVEDVLAAVEDARRRQPTRAEDIDCPRPQGEDGPLVAAPDTYDGRLADLGVDTAVVCYGPDLQGAPDRPPLEGPLDGDAFVTVLDDLLRNATARPQLAGRCADSGPTRLLVLTGPQGRVTLTDAACSGEFSFAGGFWVAGPESEDALAAALGGHSYG